MLKTCSLVFLLPLQQLYDVDTVPFYGGETKAQRIMELAPGHPAS